MRRSGRQELLEAVPLSIGQIAWIGIVHALECSSCCHYTFLQSTFSGLRPGPRHMGSPPLVSTTLRPPRTRQGFSVHPVSRADVGSSLSAQLWFCLNSYVSVSHV
jgi:hypothetical protein